MNLTITTEYDNWLILLQDLVNGKITLDGAQYYSVLNYARNWPTCACGQLCKALPRLGDTSAPADEQLSSWGCQFAGFVSVKDWKAALAVFKNIEARSTSLLRQLRAAEAKLIADFNGYY